jgi:multiple sugar transport system substrate-binding protein
MNLKKMAIFGALSVAAVSALALSGVQAQSRTTLRVFYGSTLRPDVIEPIFRRFERKFPDIQVVSELGGATSELQNQYLTTALAAKDSSLDVMLIDVIRPAQFVAQGWLEPLDQFLGGDDARKTFLDGYLPGPVSADLINNELYALPATSDVQSLYYRKDLLEKYNLNVPRTWEEVFNAAQIVMKGENNSSLQGLNFQGAPIEGAVCTFLQPFWAAGGQAVTSGKVTINNAAGKRSLQLWVDAINKYKVSPLSMAETRTDDSRKIMQAGNAVFGLNWAYAWAHFQGNSPDATKVKGNIGVTRLPTFQSGGVASSTCQGGFQWGLSKFSKNKRIGFELMKFMSEVDAARDLSIKAGFLPVRKSLYNNGAVLRANPHYADLYPIVLKARPRPVTANYPKVSEIIRTNLNAVVAGAKTVDKALEDMQNGLEPLFK